MKCVCFAEQGPSLETVLGGELTLKIHTSNIHHSFLPNVFGILWVHVFGDLQSWVQEDVVQ